MSGSSCSGSRPVRASRQRKLSQQRQRDKARELDDDKCHICLAARGLQDRGRLPLCDHYFCFTCIRAWADCNNSCPICKAKFRAITRIAMQPKSPSQPTPSPKKVFVSGRRKDERFGTQDDDEVEEWAHDGGAGSSRQANSSSYDLDDSFIDDSSADSLAKPLKEYLNALTTPDTPTPDRLARRRRAEPRAAASRKRRRLIPVCSDAEDSSPLDLQFSDGSPLVNTNSDTPAGDGLRRHRSLDRSGYSSSRSSSRARAHGTCPEDSPEPELLSDTDSAMETEGDGAGTWQPPAMRTRASSQRHSPAGEPPPPPLGRRRSSGRRRVSHTRERSTDQQSHPSRGAPTPPHPIKATPALPDFPKTPKSARKRLVKRAAPRSAQRPRAKAKAARRTPVSAAPARPKPKPKLRKLAAAAAAVASTRSPKRGSPSKAQRRGEGRGRPRMDQVSLEAKKRLDQGGTTGWISMARDSAGGLKERPVAVSPARSSCTPRASPRKKRARSAYILFCMHQRPGLRDLYPEEDSKAITSRLGAEWRAMGESRKAPYEARSKAEQRQLKAELQQGDKSG